MNGLLTLPDFYTVFPQMDTTTTIGTQKQSNSTIQGTVVAIYEVGCAVGALSCFFIGDVLGRRRTILLAAVFAVAGLALMATSFSLGQLITARVITGLGVGAFTATVPMWVSESSKAHDRGSMVMLEGSFAIGGVCLCTWIEFGLFFAKNNQVNWRLPMAFPSIFAIVVLVLVMFLPESPRWLAAQGRDDEARLALSRLDDLPIDSIFITKDLHEIKNSIDKEHSGYSGSPFALTPNRHLHRTLLAVAVNILAQMCGVNIISFYSNTIFQNTLGFSSTLSRLVTGCLQTWQFICASSALLVVDRIGRRPLLITCAIGMAISQAGLAGLTAHADNKGAAGATLLFNFTSLFFFPVGLFLVPFMYAAEIAPLRIRAKVTSIATVSFNAEAATILFILIAISASIGCSISLLQRSPQLVSHR